MAAIWTELFGATGLFTQLLNFVMTMLTPAATGPSGFQVIIYAGLTIGFIGATIGYLKNLARG